MSTEEIDYTIVSLLWPHIGPQEVKEEEESDFMKIMIKVLRYMNAPLLLLFFGKQEIIDAPLPIISKLYVSPDNNRPPDGISFVHRIWMVLLISSIPILLLGLDYKNQSKSKNKSKAQTRKYTNSISVWILMFAVLTILYSKPYISSAQALGFLVVSSIVLYTGVFRLL